MVPFNLEDPDFREVGRDVPQKLGDDMGAGIKLREDGVMLGSLVAVNQSAIEHVSQHGDHELFNRRVGVLLDNGYD